MPSIEFNLSNIENIQKLFRSVEHEAILDLNLECLGSELGLRAKAVNAISSLSLSSREKFKQYKMLSETISYSSDRFSDIFIRNQQIRWMRENLFYEPEVRIHDETQNPKLYLWQNYLGLAIKDFHQDLSSFMDSLVLVILQASGQINYTSDSFLPGWESLINVRKHNYRRNLSQKLIETIDITDKWWREIKKVRELVTHRKHDRIIYGNPKDGLLFQIYDQTNGPRIFLPQILYQTGLHVVDYDLYFGFIIIEIITLLDILGTEITSLLKIIDIGLDRMSLRIVDKSVLEVINRLKQILEIDCKCNIE